MFHFLAFGGLKTDSTLNEAAPGVVDQGWTLNAQNRYIFPSRMKVFAAGAMNDTITRARINAPSLRNTGLPEIYPTTVSDDPAALPLVAYFDQDGPEVQATEAVGIDTSNGASTVDRIHAWMCVRERKFPLPSGRRLTIVGTSTQTLLLDAWTAGTITLDQDLPFGTYAVIGMACVCNDAWGARLVFPGYTNWRPGIPNAMAYAGQDVGQLFRSGRQGMWGQFVSTQPPQLELIGNAAGAETATVFLDLVAVSVPTVM
jgi:hypothetical protein